MSLRLMLKYRHKFTAWVGVQDGHYVTLLVSGPVAGE
jgi:hypothetical protein